MKALSFLIVILTLSLPLHAQETGNAFDRANAAYAAGQNADGDAARPHYEDAAQAYREALQNGDSWVLHYNLGNTEYRLGNYGHAALHYEKALALNPDKAEIQANLELARKAAGLNATREESTAERWATTLPLWVWLLAASVFGWALVALLVLPPFFRGYSISSLGAAILCAVLLAGSGYGLVGWHVRAHWQVVKEADTPLLSAPVDTATPLRFLDAATAVKPERKYEDWVFVRSERGDEGWLKLGQAESAWEM